MVAGINIKEQGVINTKNPLISPIQSFSIVSINVTESSSSTTYSTSSGEESAEGSSFFSTDDTLNMITTPWTTESWSSHNLEHEYSRSTIVVSSLSINPQSSSSYGFITSDLGSDSRNTKILLKSNSFSYITTKIHPLSTLKSRSGTISSWSLESFTSPVKYSASNTIKVFYPWSPCSLFSETDIYPNSVYSAVSRLSLVESSTFESAKDITDVLTSKSFNKKYIF